MADPNVSWLTGKPRNPPRDSSGLHPHEIEAGRSVPNNWDDHLVETWADRKARRAREKAERTGG